MRASKTSSNASTQLRAPTKPRAKKKHLSKLEAEELQRFKDLMAKYGGKLQFAGCDK